MSLPDGIDVALEADQAKLDSMLTREEQAAWVREPTDPDYETTAKVIDLMQALRESLRRRDGASTIEGECYPVVELDPDDR
jgi:non-homologous end joining protein Ku